MKISKITIQDYGPIHSLVIEPQAFEIIFGLNETGKTALVEALSYVLFKKTRLRYSKPVKVEIEISDKTKNIHIFPAKKSMIELPPGNIASLLYIKASESNLYSDREEASFWDSITGLMHATSDRVPLTKVIEKIYNRVGITLKKEEWQDDKKRLIASEQKRKKEIANYIDRIGNVENEENELAILAEKEKELTSKINEIEHYKKFLFYRQTSDLYEEFCRIKSNLQDYDRHKYDYHSEWQKLNIEKQNAQKTSAKIKEINVELKDLEKEIQELEVKQKKIDAAGLGSAFASTKSPLIPYWIISLFIFCVIAIIFIISLSRPSLRLYACIVGLIGLPTAVFFFFKHRHCVRSRFAGEQILVKAQQVFPDLKTIEDIPRLIKDIDENIKIKSARFEEKTRSAKDLGLNLDITDIETQIKDLRDKTGLAELSDLDLKIKEKRMLDDKFSRIRAQLEEKIHEKDELKWPLLIKSYEVRSTAEKPNLATESGLRKDLETIKSRIEKLEYDIRFFREITRQQFEISEHRQAFLEYDQINKKLDGYEQDRLAALEIKKILTEMSNEMENFIIDIFNGPGSLSDLFYSVTEKYKRVQFENKKFIAYNRDNKPYNVDDLSSGTRDQLLLCFRLAAVKKIYPDGCFMILDDAFIFADWPRRRRLADVLVKFSQTGFQIIYLTSDDHTRDLLLKAGAHLTNLV